MILSILIGFGTSIVVEIIAKINKEMTGTPFQGQGAFLFAFAIAVVLAFLKVIVLPLIPASFVQNFMLEVGLVFASQQVFFQWVIKLFSLNVGAPQLPGTVNISNS